MTNATIARQRPLLSTLLAALCGSALFIGAVAPAHADAATSPAVASTFHNDGPSNGLQPLGGPVQK